MHNRIKTYKLYQWAISSVFRCFSGEIRMESEDARLPVLEHFGFGFGFHFGGCVYYNKFYNVLSCGPQNLHAGSKLLSITGSRFHWPQQNSAGSLVCCIIQCSQSTATAYLNFQSCRLSWWHNFRAFKLHKNVLGKVRAAGRNHPLFIPIVMVTKCYSRLGIVLSPCCLSVTTALFSLHSHAPIRISVKSIFRLDWYVGGRSCMCTSLWPRPCPLLAIHVLQQLGTLSAELRSFPGPASFVFSLPLFHDLWCSACCGIHCDLGHAPC